MHADKGDFRFIHGYPCGTVSYTHLENDVVRIVLQNASIHSASTAPIYVKKAKKVILSLPQGTKNSITDTDSYEVNTDKDVYKRQLYSLMNSQERKILFNYLFLG